MEPHHLLRTVRVSKQLALLLAFLASAVALSVVSLVSSTAQSPEKEGREIEDMIPKHLPVKVKVKNIEKIKDLKNEKWVRDFELEVENTSGRPIYYLNFGMYVPEVKAPDGTVIGFTFRYGRVNLIDYTVLAGPDDIPLLPGATHVFKLTEQNLKGWELIRAEHPNPKKLRLKLHYLHFGDGTGLLGPDGTPVGGKKVSGNNCSAGRGDPDKSPLAVSPKIQATFIPANFLPVNFYPAGAVPRAAGTGATTRDVCCPGTGCARRRPAFYDCHCGPDRDYVESVGCHQTQWACADVAEGPTETCFDSGGRPVFCPTFIVVPCGTANPTPTPSPTPTPTPLCTPEGCEAINPCSSCGGGQFLGCSQPICPGGPAVDLRTYPQTGCPATADPTGMGRPNLG